MIDLTRSVFTVNLGIRDVDPNAQILQGQIVALDTEGRITLADGVDAYGVAKWNKADTFYSPVVDESIQLNGTTPSNLDHANIKSGSVRVTSSDGSTVYAETTDYTVNYTNGQITRVGAGNIPDGATVLVTYSYQMTEYELKVIRGTNYQNATDDTLGSGKMTVAQDFFEIYTDQYDTSQGYTPGDVLYVGSGATAGLFTTDNASGKAYGIVVKAPSASDPLLGVQVGR